MNIIAMDLGKFNSMFCFYDSETQDCSTAKAPTDRKYFHSVLKSKQPDLVVCEACGSSDWVKDLCEELELEIIVCSTHEDAWLFKNVKRKTDKDDAIKLARLAALGELKATYVPAKPMRELRRTIKYRKQLVGRINKCKNTIRAIFANQGIKITSGAKTWHTGRQKLVDECKPLVESESDELWRGELDLELTQLAAVEEHLKTVDKKLDSIAASDPRIQRVMQIGGVGRVTAEAIVAHIDDPHRFANKNQVSAYAGLVPRQYQSGNTDRHGRITKRGSRLLRTFAGRVCLVQLAIQPVEPANVRPDPSRDSSPEKESRCGVGSKDPCCRLGDASRQKRLPAGGEMFSGRRLNHRRHQSIPMKQKPFQRERRFTLSL